MWLVTPIGFFSIVQKPGDKKNGTLTVRSRVRSDLAALQQHYLPGLGPIQESHDTDYRFRAVAPRSEVSAAMARMVDGLDYSNFKSEVAKKQGHKRQPVPPGLGCSVPLADGPGVCGEGAGGRKLWWRGCQRGAEGAVA